MRGKERKLVRVQKKKNQWSEGDTTEYGAPNTKSC